MHSHFVLFPITYEIIVNPYTLHNFAKPYMIHITQFCLSCDLQQKKAKVRTMQQKIDSAKIYVKIIFYNKQKNYDTDPLKTKLFTKNV